LRQGINFEQSWNSVRVLSNTFDHITQEAVIYHKHIDSNSDVGNNIFFDVGGNVGDGAISCSDFNAAHLFHQ